MGASWDLLLSLLKATRELNCAEKSKAEHMSVGTRTERSEKAEQNRFPLSLDALRLRSFFMHFVSFYASFYAHGGSHRSWPCHNSNVESQRMHFLSVKHLIYSLQLKVKNVFWHDSSVPKNFWSKHEESEPNVVNVFWIKA